MKAPGRLYRPQSLIVYTKAHRTTALKPMGTLTGQNLLQACIQQPLIENLETQARVERRIPWHIGKGGQGQFPRPGLTRRIGHLL